MRDDHEGVTIRRFMGFFDRGNPESVPRNHFISESNLIFAEEEVLRRPGLSPLVLTDLPVKRVRVVRVGSVTGYMFATDEGVSSRLFFSGESLTTEIASFGVAFDFERVEFFGRTYITPLQATPQINLTGLPNENVHVYQGGASTREAGGEPPSTQLTATAGVAGNMGTGLYHFTVAFETDTGFITRPATPFTSGTIPVANDGTGSFSFTTIPTGPAGTVARHIIVSPRLPTNFNLAGFDPETGLDIFFLRRIDDNTTTSLADQSWADSELVDSANYLLGQLDRIPAGIKIGTYGNRMVVIGTADEPSVALISRAGQPESFDAVQGRIEFDPSDPRGLRNLLELRDNLYLFKPSKTYVTFDNGEFPANWGYVNVDNAIGTTHNGTSAILESQGSFTDRLIVTDRSGIYPFDGTYNPVPLSFKIQSFWDSQVNSASYDEIEAVVDTVLRRILIAIPIVSIEGGWMLGVVGESELGETTILGSGFVTPGRILMGDYSFGLTPEAIRWSVWDTTPDVRTLTIRSEDVEKPIVVVGSSNNGNNPAILQFLSNASDDDGVAFEAFLRLGSVSLVDYDSLMHLGSIRFRIRPEGDLIGVVSGLDDNDEPKPFNLPGIVTTGRTVVLPTNFINERVSVRLDLFPANFETFGTPSQQLRSITLFLKEIYRSRIV